MSYNLNISGEILIGTISQLYISSNGWQAYTYQNLYAKIKNQNEQSKQTTIVFSLRQKIDKLYFYNDYSYSYSFFINNIQIKSGSVSQGTINTSEKEILSWEHIFQHDNEGKCSFNFSYSGPISVGSSGVTTKNITGSCTIPSFNVAPQILSLNINSETYGILIGEFSYNGIVTKGEVLFNQQTYQVKKLSNTSGCFNISYNLQEERPLSLPCVLRLYNEKVFNDFEIEVEFDWPEEYGIEKVNFVNLKEINIGSLDMRYQINLKLKDTSTDQCLINFFKVTEYNTQIYSNIYDIKLDEQGNKYVNFYLYNIPLRNNDIFYITVALYKQGFMSRSVESDESVTIRPLSIDTGGISWSGYGLTTFENI